MPEPRDRDALGLRVLMIGPLPPPVGGMASVTENLREVLRGRCALRVLNNVKTTPADRTLAQAVGAQLGLLTALVRILVSWRPAVVHIHTCSYGTFWRNGLDALIARLLGRTVVLHIHGAQFHKFIQGLGGGERLGLRAVLGLASALVVLGDGWRDVLRPWARDGRIWVVPNGVPVPDPVPAADLPGAGPGAAQAAPMVLCLANYERRKGLEDLVRALAHLGPRGRLHLRLHGAAAEPREQERIQALVQTLGLGGAVELGGPITGAEKDRALRECAAFCLPSYDEGLPMAMLEAMAWARPVIVTRVGAIPEVITDGCNGMLVAPGDWAGLAVALARVAAADPALAAMGKAGRALVVQRYAVAASADRLLDLWQRLARGAAAAPD